MFSRSTEALQRDPAADHDTDPRCPRQTGDDRDGCGQQQRAGGGYDEDCDRADQGAADQPGQSRRRDGQRQEPGGVAVGKSDDRCALGAGLLDQGDDAGVGAVGRGGGGPQLECAARVQYAAADLVADLSLDRVCLTGQRGFIQHCEASLDEAVDGQDLPR